MAKKDIDVNIRTRASSATRNARAFADTLKRIKADGDAAAPSVSNLGSSFSAMAADAAKLNNKVRDLNQLSKLVSDLDRTRQAAERFDSAIARSANGFSSLRVRGEEAARVTANYRDQLAAQERAQQSANADLARATEEQAKNNRVLKEAERALKQYNQQLFTQGRGSNRSQVTTVLNQEQLSRGSVLTSAVTEAQARKRQLEASVGALKGTSDAAKASIDQLKVAVSSAAAEEKDLARETLKAGNALLSLRVDGNNARQALDATENKVLEANAALGTLAFTQEEVAAASDKAKRALARESEALDIFNRLSRQKLRSGGTIMDATASEQRQALEQARREVDLLREAQTKLDGQIRGSSGNVTAQVDAYDRMTRAVQLAEQQVRKLEIQQRRAAGERAAGLGSNGFGAWIANQERAANGATATLGRLNNASGRTAQNMGRIAPAAQRAAGGMRGLANESDRAGSALTRSGNASRNALSLFQRIRSEVIALTASYIGLNAALDQGRSAVAAYQTLEAVQSRLGAVMNQDTAAVSREIDFLRAQSDRLGISFAVLADEYGKLTVAARASNFSMADTREIFLSVAEAARVNRLSADQMSGVFLALSQMISKGKVSSEELRRQLGDRLTGAFNIFAEAIGVSAAELDRMMRAGEVLSDRSTMLAFARELTERFGPQLADSLNTVTTDLGRFENSIFSVQLAMAQGFIPALRVALQSFNSFAQSADGAQLFANLGQAAGSAIQLFSLLAQNLDLLAIAGAAFVGIRLGQYMTGLVAPAGRLAAIFRATSEATQIITTSTARAQLAQTALGSALLTSVTRIDLYRGRMLAASSATGTMGLRTRVLAGSLGVLRAAMVATAGIARTLWAAIGGLPGLVATGIVVALGSWLTSTNNATSALVEHERQINLVRQAYQLAEGDVARLAETVREMTELDARQNLVQLEDAFADATSGIRRHAQIIEGLLERFTRARDEALSAGAPGAAPPDALINEFDLLNRAIDDFLNQRTSVDEFKATLSDLALNSDFPAIRELASETDNLVDATDDEGRSLGQLGDSLRRQRAVIELFTDSTNSAAQATLGLTEATDDANAEFRASQIETYNTALNDLREAVPDLKDEMELLARATQLNETAMRGFVAAFQSAGLADVFRAFASGNIMGALRSMSSIMGSAGGQIGALGGAYNQANTAIDIERFGSAGAAMAAQFLRELEGFRPQAYWDVNAYRTGYGSDTTTDPNGMVSRVTASTVTTLADAERDLARRINEFRDTVISEIGADRFNALGAAQQGVLTSLAYNYGSLSGTGQLGTFRNGTVEEMVAAIRSLAGHNDGVNAGRRNREADAFAADGTTYQLGQQAYEQDVERARLARERGEENAHQIEQQRLINAHREREAAIADAVFQAEQEIVRTRGEGATLSEQELASIREQAAALWDAQNPRYEMERSEERINQLMAVRQELMSQMDLAREMGDASALTSLRTELEAVNARLQEAIPGAIAMWRAVGGAEAEAAIARLRTAQIETSRLGGEMGWFGLSVQTWNGIFDSALNGLMGAFDAMGQAIANGENAFKAFGMSVLQTLAQVLQQIAVTIIRMMILRMLSGAGGPIGNWASAALTAGGGMMGHTGGIVGTSAIGSGNRIGKGPDWVSAIYHTGGIAGLAPDEVNATLRVGEEIVTETDPRHRNNMGGSKPADTGTRLSQVLAIGEKQIADALRGKDGRDVMLTHIKTDAPTIRRILGVS